MNSDLLYDSPRNSPHVDLTRESHPSMCTHHVLLRSTQGGCRYVTMHRSSSVRVHMKHRASRRKQEPTHIFGRGTAVHSSRERTNTKPPGLASRAKLEKFMMYARGLLPVAVSRYEHLRVLVLLGLYLYLSRLVPYDPSLAVPSSVASHSRSCC